MSIQQQRREYAQTALEEYCNSVWRGKSLSDLPKGDHRDLVADLIGDLLHYARNQRLEPEKRISQAVNNFNSETLGKEIDLALL